MPYEWTGPGKTAHPAGGFGAAAPGGSRCWNACMAQRKPVFLSRSQPPRRGERLAVCGVPAAAKGKGGRLPLHGKRAPPRRRCGAGQRPAAPAAAGTGTVQPQRRHGGGCGPADGHAGPARLPGHRGRAGRRALYFAGGGRLPGYPGYCRHQRQPRLCLRQPAAVVCLPGHGRCVRPGPAFPHLGGGVRRFSAQHHPAGVCRAVRAAALHPAPALPAGPAPWALPGAEGDFTGRSLVDAARRSMAAERVGVPPGLPDLLLAPPGRTPRRA